MIDFSKVVTVKSVKIEAGDYILNLGEVLKVELTAQFTAFTIRGLCISAVFFWYKNNQELQILKKNKS